LGFRFGNNLEFSRNSGARVSSGIRVWDFTYNCEVVIFIQYEIRVCYLPYSLTEIQFGSRVRMLPLPKKYILKCQKLPNKKLIFSSSHAKSA
jgi:hypothetical protein